MKEKYNDLHLVENAIIYIENPWCTKISNIIKKIVKYSYLSIHN